MLFKSALVTQASGSVGGMTASHNKGGMYFRARSIPVNPASSFQTAVRNALGALVNIWNSVLTSTQRTGWENYAAVVYKTNPLGDQLQLSGQQWYIACNTPRIQAGLARVDTAPTQFDRGQQDETIVITASEATQNLAISYDDTLPWADEDGSSMLLYSSRPQNPTINFFRGPYRLAGTIDGDSSTPPTSPGSIAAPFAFVAGQRIFSAVAFTRADGRLTSRSRFLTTTAA